MPSISKFLKVVNLEKEPIGVGVPISGLRAILDKNINCQGLKKLQQIFETNLS
jgi:hypothetical protein